MNRRREKHLTEEHRLKISESLKRTIAARPRQPHSAETLAKISSGLKARWATLEFRDKQRRRHAQHAELSLFDTHELAWAAGFFDGEGCSYLTGNGSPRKYARIGIAQVDPWVLRRFQAAVLGLGRVLPRARARTKQPNHSDYWEFKANGFEITQAILALLWNYLSPVKREQARRVLQQAD